MSMVNERPVAGKSSFAFEMFMMQQAITTAAHAGAIDITHEELLLLWAMSHFGRGGRGMCPGAVTLAERTLMHAKSVQRIVPRLRAKGVLVVEGEPSRGYRATTYRFCDAILTAFAALAAEHQERATLRLAHGASKQTTGEPPRTIPKPPHEIPEPPHTVGQANDQPCTSRTEQHASLSSATKREQPHTDRPGPSTSALTADSPWPKGTHEGTRIRDLPDSYIAFVLDSSYFGRREREALRAERARRATQAPVATSSSPDTFIARQLGLTVAELRDHRRAGRTADDIQHLVAARGAA